MIVRSLALLAAMLFLVPLLPASANAEEADLTEEENTLYFLGIYVARNLKYQFGVRPEEAELVSRAVAETLRGEEESLDEVLYMPRINQLARSRHREVVEDEKEKSAVYLDAMAAEAGAIETETGLVFLEQKKGDGATPDPSSVVAAHYEGRLRDGTVFDSSLTRGRPHEFKLAGVLKCWTEALQMMQVGGRAKITCPADLAYGERGMPPSIPGGAALTFEVELLSIQ